MQDRGLSAAERQEANVIGSVSTTFQSFQFFHIQAKEHLKNRAYTRLKKAAQNTYEGNTDIVNVKISGGFSGIETFFILYFPASVLGNFQKITATGDVVMFDAGSNVSVPNEIHRLLPGINSGLIDKLPGNSRTAVLSISCTDQTLAENVVDDIEMNLVESGKFTVVDRRRLDDIRRERNFQLSGDVGDDSAVSIGSMMGANVVIVGSITTTASGGRITIKALDVKTGEVIVMVIKEF
jgi:TolB-like protein